LTLLNIIGTKASQADIQALRQALPNIYGP
jgi:hypothetical protein